MSTYVHLKKVQQQHLQVLQIRTVFPVKVHMNQMGNNKVPALNVWRVSTSSHYTSILEMDAAILC